jgi:hypothetical protein
MMFIMFRFLHQRKIIDSVINFVSVFMVNNLSRNKVSPKMFFHHKAVFQNIISLCLRVAETVNKHITSAIYLSMFYPAISRARSRAEVIFRAFIFRIREAYINTTSLTLYPLHKEMLT